MDFFNSHRTLHSKPLGRGQLGVVRFFANYFNEHPLELRTLPDETRNELKPVSVRSFRPVRLTSEGVIHAKSVTHSGSVTNRTQAGSKRTRPPGRSHRCTSGIESQQRVAHNRGCFSQTTPHPVSSRPQGDQSRAKSTLGETSCKWPGSHKAQAHHVSRGSPEDCNGSEGTLGGVEDEAEESGLTPS
jgi:hypothetical protein